MLSAGDTLVLYSDGLVERRDETLDDGLERLRLAATQAVGSQVDTRRGVGRDAGGPRELGGRHRHLDVDRSPTFRRRFPRDAKELAPTRPRCAPGWKTKAAPTTRWKSW